MSKWSEAKQVVAELCERASEHGADEAGMLEALLSTAMLELGRQKDAAYAKNFVEYEAANLASALSNSHVDVARNT